MRILVINGPNLNLLGKRNKHHYGTKTLDEINKQLVVIAQKQHVALAFFQSNHEGELIDFIQKESGSANGILINPGALTHYSIALADSLRDAHLPTIDVHLSDIAEREDFRKVNVLEGIVDETISGLKEQSYYQGLTKLIDYITKGKT